MPLTLRDIEILLILDRYYVLNRPLIQELCFPADTKGRITRRRLQFLVSERLVNRLPAVIFQPDRGSVGSIYYPARRGCEFLAEYREDDRYLATCTQSPQTDHVLHWLAISRTHITLDQAVAKQAIVQCDGWLNEWDTVNKDELLPEKRYRIYTLLRESPRLVCAPDSVFLLSAHAEKKVFYLEENMNTSGVRRIAASKTPGYAELAKQQLHRRHFPDATVDEFNVLMIAPHARRRDALLKAMRDKDGAHLWKFAVQSDLTADTFLFAPIWHRCDGEPAPLVDRDYKPEASSESDARFATDSQTHTTNKTQTETANRTET